MDTVPEMGPFEIALGTQWEDGLYFDYQMFPDRSTWSRYSDRAVRKLPDAGDISARSAVTLHCGTENVSVEPRPVLVLGVDAPGAGHDELHGPQVTAEFSGSVPIDLRRHLLCRVVAKLEPIVQEAHHRGTGDGEP